MPFNNFNTRHRLGVANPAHANGFRWAKEILRLPSDTFNATFPIYQQQLVRSTRSGSGPDAPTAAEQDGILFADNEIDLNNVIRQVSIHDTEFSSRNVSSGQTPNAQYSLQNYAAARSNKVFYVNNEPEANYKIFNSNPPASNTIDTYTGININNFWEPSNPLPETDRKIRSDALALVYLRLRNNFGSNGHKVLPPCASSAFVDVGTGAAFPYWANFYNLIHPWPPLPPGGVPAQTITVGGQTATKINPADLTAFHQHYYSPPRYLGPYNAPAPNMPLETVAEGAHYLRKTIDWYRNRFVSANQPLPLDVMLSEFGYFWRFERKPPDPTALPGHIYWWGGGWNNFRDGLSWWNSWLCWVLRYAPTQFNLAGSPNGNWTDSRAVYAGIHNPAQAPYVTDEPNEIINGTVYWTVGYGTRNQILFNCDSWTVGNALSLEFIHTQLQGSGRFISSFSCFPTTTWNDGLGNPASNWRFGPFGVTYKVWADVGADQVTGDLSTGWADNTVQGDVGTVLIQLFQGYNTVYLPVIKTANGAYGAGTRVEVVWKNGAQEVAFGYGDMAEFPNSQDISTIYDTAPAGQLVGRAITPAQPVKSAMVFPVVCYSAQARNVTIKIKRVVTGPTLRIGRPIVIRGACSWLNNQ